MLVQTAILPARGLAASNDAIDFAAWRDYDEMVRLGVDCVLRYVSTSSFLGVPSYSWKSLRPSEVLEYHKRGIGIIALWEAGGTDPLQGYSKGLAHGKQAVISCTALGYPLGLSVIAAVDFDVTPSNLNAAYQYMRGFNDGLAGKYATGVYGDIDIIQQCAWGQICTVFHYAGAASWSHRAWLEIVHLKQSIVASTPNYDNNYVLRELPMWLPHDEPDPTPAPAPTPIISGGSDMTALRIPHTVFDTRAGFGKMPAGWEGWIDIQHPEVTSATIHLTVVNPKAAGWIKVWDASAGTEPPGATVDYTSGISGVDALVPVTGGKIYFKTSAELEGLVITVQGGSA